MVWMWSEIIGVGGWLDPLLRRAVDRGAYHCEAYRFLGAVDSLAACRAIVGHPPRRGAMP
jgi:hypothetical protein